MNQYNRKVTNRNYNNNFVDLSQEAVVKLVLQNILELKVDIHIGKEFLLQINENMYNWIYVHDEKLLDRWRDSVKCVIPSKFCLFPPIKIYVLGSNMHIRKEGQEIHMNLKEQQVEEEVIPVTFGQLQEQLSVPQS